jgi:hypothetical protein
VSAAQRFGISSLSSELSRTQAGERGKFGSYLLEIAPAAVSPSPTADDLAEPNDGTRVQVEHAAQLKDPSAQPAQFTSTT